jgi:1,4-alpha-glucan branching enzyme
MKTPESLMPSKGRRSSLGGGGARAEAPRLVSVSLRNDGRGRPLKAPVFHDHEARPVKLVYFNPAAREVLLAGTFNNWQPHRTPMIRNLGGVWGVELLLKPGDYEYRFVVDGEWHADPTAPRAVANPFGGLNSLITVGSASKEEARRI